MLRGLPLDLDVAEPELRRIDDPYELTLEHLIALSDVSFADREARAIAISNMAWYAGVDPFVLARERAVVGLGRLGRELGLERLAAPPAEAATPDDVVGELSDLVAAIGAAQAGRVGWPEALEAAADGLAAKRYDIEGGKIVLEVLARLIPTAGAEDLAPWRPFWELVDGLERRLVAMSLDEAHRDPHPVVLAAAVTAGLRATGGEGQATLELLLGDEQLGIRPNSHELVRSAAMRWMARNGCPHLASEQAQSDSRAGGRRPEALWVELAIKVLQDARLEGPVAGWSCKALDTLTDAPLSTLRGEEWLTWYFEGGGRMALAGKAPPASDS